MVLKHEQRMKVMSKSEDSEPQSKREKAFVPRRQVRRKICIITKLHFFPPERIKIAEGC